LIAILDYGSGNLRSAERAFATTGQEVVLTSDPVIALEADGLVVPGVGAFSSCMNGINAVNGVAIVQERLNKERPVLGICIGMQIMFSQGTENTQGEPVKGIGIWNGVVDRLNAPILPHMGWNTVALKASDRIVKNLTNLERYYFVHSYYVKIKDKKNSLMKTNYGFDFDSGIFQENLYGFQFHPEKSHRYGMKIFKNFTQTNLQH
jgi:glutamine amidotransferase